MRVDLHNHTTLCNHANGTMREYVEQAIEKKIDIFGFSEHAPMDFDPEYRMKFEDVKFYKDEFKKLKSEFKDDIELLLGYEVDFLRGKMSEDILKDKDVDYLIGSVHFIDEWGFDNPEFIGRYESEDIDEIWQNYFNAIEEMANSGYFDIVGHLDLIKVFKFLPKKDIKSIALNALKAIKKNDLTLEINGAGYRKPVGEAYPSRELLELAYELEIPITCSSDAHEIEQIALFSDKTEALAKSVGYTQCATFRNRNRIMINF
ncbi:MAG: histidinol-phosphatase [Campylobacterota bacterium]|nr:histidinol-phosphatase [Campylobacterota bacterium]